MEDEDPSIKAYPLAWPIGRPRSKSREPAPFGRRRIEYDRQTGTAKPARMSSLNIAEGGRRLVEELRRFGASNVVISTNVRPTLSGLPSRETPKDNDPGVAVYFRLNGLPHVIACDKWDRVADNLAAIAKDVEASRGRLRWGCATAAQAFAGFRELPAVGERKPWWTVLGFKDAPRSAELLERKRDELARLHHPDRGGNVNQMAEINAAYDEGRAALGARP